MPMGENGVAALPRAPPERFARCPCPAWVAQVSSSRHPWPHQAWFSRALTVSLGSPAQWTLSVGVSD